MGKRLLYVLEHFSVRGGVERIVAAKMNALAERGWDVTFLTVWQEDKPDVFPLDPRIRRCCLGVRKPGGCLTYAWALWCALRLFDRFVAASQPSACIFFRAMGAWLAGRTKWGGRIIFESHQPRSTNNHLRLYPRMQRRADCIVCLTQGDAQEYVKAKEVVVIPNFSELHPHAVGDYAVKRCLFVGRRQPEKDVERLERLWKMVTARRPEWTLDMHSTTADMTAVYARGSILLMTSRVEGFGLVLLEAMQAGLPCVAFDCPYGPADIITPDTGFLVDSKDDAAYVDAVVKLIDNEDLRRSMGERARASVQRFDKERIMDQWESLFLS